MLADVVPGSRFLDLYAGSGAVGLDAASRGAASVTWVERQPEAFRVLKRNVETLLATPSGCVPVCVRREVFAFLKGLPPRMPYTIVFADPPYETASDPGFAPLLLETLRAGGVLAPGGVAVLEQGRSPAPAAPDGWSLLTARNYGKTVLTLYRIMP